MAKKAWLKNGKVIVRDGKAVMCEECPCGCKCNCNACLSGKTPAWIKFRATAKAEDDPNGILEFTVYKACVACACENGPTNQSCGYIGSMQMRWTADQDIWAICKASFATDEITGDVSLYVSFDQFQAGKSLGIGPIDCSDILGSVGEACASFLGCPFDVEVLQVGPTTSSGCCEDGECKTCPNWTEYTTDGICGIGVGTTVTWRLLNYNNSTGDGYACGCEFSGTAAISETIDGVYWSINAVFSAYKLPGQPWLILLRLWKVKAGFPNEYSSDLFSATVDADCLPSAIAFTHVQHRGVLDQCDAPSLTYSTDSLA